MVPPITSNGIIPIEFIMERNIPRIFLNLKYFIVNKVELLTPGSGSTIRSRSTIRTQQPIPASEISIDILLHRNCRQYTAPQQAKHVRPKAA